jgi:hypothetical protein
MKKYLLGVILLLSAGLSLCAQKHDYIWTFGYNEDPFQGPNFSGMKINFNYAPPRVDTFQTNVNFDDFSVTMCDSSGALLFYTNGIRIYNKLNQLMENGDTLNPGETWEKWKDKGFPAANFGFCIPAPGKSNCYFLFHTGWLYKPPYYGFTPFYYTFIDMNANGGLGKVTQKNVILTTDSIVNPVAVKHGNGRDWWIIVGRKNTMTQLVFYVGPAGISSPTMINLDPSIVYSREGSSSQVSPNGETYIRADYLKEMRIYSFNRCTGQLGNLRIIPKNSWTNLGWGVFSPDSRYSYPENNRTMGQLDIMQLDTAAFIDTIAHSDYFPDPDPPFISSMGLPQPGPDGKLYFNTLNCTRNFHVMNRPNLPGVACDLQLHGFRIPHYYCYMVFNLPNFRLGEWENAPCDTINLQMDNSGFVRTYYDATQWTPEVQTSRRVVPIHGQNGQTEPPGTENGAELHDFNAYNRQRMEGKIHKNGVHRTKATPAIIDKNGP